MADTSSAEHPIADPARRERARTYARIRRRLFVLDLALSTGALLVFQLSGLSIQLREALSNALASWLVGTPFLVPLVLLTGPEGWATLPGLAALVTADVAVLVLASAILFLPLAWYSGFVLPHRYDLSVQSVRSWISDYVKGTLLGVVQAAIMAVPVYALLYYAPRWWWLWASLCGVLFGIVLANLAPVLIVPLFYKLQPLPDGDLRQRLVALAAAAGTRVRGVFVMDMSRRTRTANAALMGIGNTRRIVLGDTLWQRFSPAEIGAVLAHELGHHVHGDLWRSIALDAGLTLVSLWLADVVLRALVGLLGLAGIADVAGLPLLLLVTGALVVLVMPVTNGYSRAREAAADRFAVRATGDALAWMGALRKLADQNLSEVDPPRWVEWLLYSHPSIRHRLEAAAREAGGLRAMADESAGAAGGQEATDQEGRLS